MHPSDVTLTDYVDDALGDERAAVDRHLEGCAACRALVDDLLAIRRTAASMPPMAPPASAWSRLEQRIRADAPGQGTARRTLWPPTPAAFAWMGLAATLVLATIVGLRVGLLSTRTASEVGETTSAASDAAANPIETVESELRQAEEHYTRAISGLEQIANEGEGQLDPETAATLQKSLAVVDLAIDESRAAVRSEPTNESAQTSLLDNFATKIALLQDTVALINEMRKGNDAGAAQIVSGLK